MPELLEDAVSTAVLHVMETAAFMSVWPYQDSDGELTAPDVAATMTFSGPIQGRLTLRVAAEILPQLTQNMLGELEPEDSPEEKGRDALREMLNMICGNLLTEWQGEEAVFNLSPPEIVLQNSSDWKADAAVKFNLENSLAIIEIGQ